MKAHALPWANARLLEQSGGIDTLLPWFETRELEIANAFARPERREQWLLSRAAMKQLAVDRRLVETPSECGVDTTRLVFGEVVLAFASLSHSGRYAAVAIDDVPVGVDVQVVRDLSERAGHLFLTPEEEAAMGSCAIAHRLLHFWCAKEAAWKARGGTTPTLRQVPLSLLSEGATGLRFDTVETVATGDVIVALTRPTL